MMKLDIGKCITAMLTADPTVAAKVGNRVYPISTKVETTTPLVVYVRTSTETQYGKDGAVLDKMQVSLYVVGDTYAETVEIAEAVRAAVEFRAGVFGGVYLKRAWLETSSEDYDYTVDKYIQVLTFWMKIYNTKINITE